MYRLLSLAFAFPAFLLAGCDSNEEPDLTPLTVSIIVAPSSTTPTGQDVVFTAVSFTSDIERYSWDLDGDGNEDDTGESAVFVYTTAGTYEAALRVTDADGQSTNVSEIITVTRVNVAPTAAFSYTPLAPRAGEEVTFTAAATDSDGSVAAYSWDFDADGTEDASGPVATYTFEDDGTFSVRLDVTDDEGATDNQVEQVSVADRFTSVTITRITVTDFPFTDANGQPWDPASGPDVFFALLDENQQFLASSSAAVDAQESDLPLVLDFTFESTDLSAFYFFGVYEEDIEAGTSRLVNTAALPDSCGRGSTGRTPTPTR